MKELDYPFKSEELLRKRKIFKEKLLETDLSGFKKIRIAVLSGSSVKDVIEMLELFLLNSGFLPDFYEGDYNRYYEEAVFENERLDEFDPDIVYVYTTSRNIKNFPNPNDDEQSIKRSLEEEYSTYEQIWNSLREKYKCVIIQNNFEMTIERNFGNMDAVIAQGRLNYINGLNALFYDYALRTDNFKICDINYLSACYGLREWSDSKFWFLYKYALNVKAVPKLSYAVFTIIKSLYGKNKKCIVTDLDNTLWGGIIAEDGVENIQVGAETAEGEMYSDVQRYLMKLKKMGILLAVASKNEEDIAYAGINNPHMSLNEEDFVSIKANFERKDKNIYDIANELNILPDSMVFLDDNPAELMLAKDSMEGISLVSTDRCECVIPMIEEAGFFETSSLTQDDIERNSMYRAEKKRYEQAGTYADYGEYLKSLEMQATIAAFTPDSYQRVTQLTNKSNQFNLTTHRYTQAEIEDISSDRAYVTLYGRLEDRFGDNGIVSVIIGRKRGDVLSIELWLMSCRVLKRDMELAMFDSLVAAAKKNGVKSIEGVYIPTEKNKMVEKFYEELGFRFKGVGENNSTLWELQLNESLSTKNKYISVRMK